MKKGFKFLFAAASAAVFLLLAPARAAAIEIVVAGGAGNAGYTSDGTLPHSIFPNITFGVSGEVGDYVTAGLTIEQDAVFGRKLAADFSYEAGFITLKAGPVFGLLNGTDGGKLGGALLQPGLRIGVSLFFLEKLLIEASSDFCFQLQDSPSATFYPSEAKVALGLVLPQFICSLEVNQKSASVSGSGAYTQTRTDYGLYTFAFGKTSPFRLGVNFIYRTLDYESDVKASSTKSLVLGARVEARVKSVEIFLNGEGSIYTFDDAGENPFVFNAIAGVKIRTR